MTRFLALFISHALVGGIGFGLGIYALPILTAPRAPTVEEINTMRGETTFTAQFRRDLKGSDFLHWGEGKVHINSAVITFLGQLAPGPDYKLYLSPKFVETEDDFNELKSEMIRVGDVVTFDNFVVAIPDNIDPNEFNTVIVWCEAFGQFITAAQYK